METKATKILIILNGVSRKKKLFYRKIYPTLSKQFDTQIWETTYAGHAERLGNKASAEGYSVILAAGGDGTLHQILNGVLANDLSSTPILGLIPLGSGNDTAGTFGLKADATQLAMLLKTLKPRLVDVGMAITSYGKSDAIKRFFFNECSLGMGPEVVRRINQRDGPWGPGMMYLKAIVSTFFSLKPCPIRISGDHYEWSGKARVFVAANGRSFGHSIFIAPKASPTDGLLNTFLAQNMSMWRFLFLLQKLKAPKQVSDPFLEYRTVAKVDVDSAEALPVEADGELIGTTPLHCEVVPRKIQFLY